MPPVACDVFRRRGGRGDGETEVGGSSVWEEVEKSRRRGESLF